MWMDMCRHIYLWAHNNDYCYFLLETVFLGGSLEGVWIILEGFRGLGRSKGVCEGIIVSKKV